MTRYRFYKEDNNWFIDMPDYIAAGGEKDDLQMVMGADEFLEFYANGTDEIRMDISERSFDKFEQNSIDKR